MIRMTGVLQLRIIEFMQDTASNMGLYFVFQIMMLICVGLITYIIRFDNLYLSEVIIYLIIGVYCPTVKPLISLMLSQNSC